VVAALTAPLTAPEEAAEVMAVMAAEEVVAPPEAVTAPAVAA
jgi:hypothetical protein